MRKIEMVDLNSQYQKIKNEVDQAISQVIDTSSFINGEAVKRFQSSLENFLDVKHVIPCGNGTDALQIALMALDLKPGDEVISVDFTFAATIEVISLLKLKTVLVDVDYQTFNINVEELEKAIGPKTKAIIPVHLFGQVANMEKIMEIASKHNLYVIEDCAQALGAEYKFSNGSIKKAGTIGHIGTTSFFPSKNLGCFGDGGAIFTDNDNLALRLRAIANHGMHQRYYYKELGVNSRLDSIQAAVLNIKLKHLDQYNHSRQHAADFYNRAFAPYKNIETPYNAEYSTHIYHQYTLKLKNINRDDLKLHLEKKNIPAMVYYPVPLHLQEAYASNNFDPNAYPVTDMLCTCVLSLPMHSELEKDQLSYICESVIEFVK